MSHCYNKILQKQCGNLKAILSEILGHVYIKIHIQQQDKSNRLLLEMYIYNVITVHLHSTFRMSQF